MTCALAWVAGPDVDPPAVHFRYIVKVEREMRLEIERRAKAAGVSPDRYVTRLVEAGLRGPEAPAPEGPADRVAFAARHRLSFSQAAVFFVLRETAVDGFASPRSADVAERVGVTRETVNMAFAALQAAGLIARLPRPGRTFQIKAEALP